MDAKAEKVALFRYGLIAPLVLETLPRGELTRRAQEIAARHYEIPHSERTSISVDTLLEWALRYRNGGFEALAPQSRQDRGQSRTITPQLADLIERLKRENPHRTGTTLLRELALSSGKNEPAISASTLYRFLKQRGLSEKQLLAPPAHKKFEAEHSNQIWQSDMLFGPYVQRPGGGKVQAYLHATLDDASRLIPHAQFYTSQGLDACLDCLRQAIAARGLPVRLYMDNAKIYRGQQLARIAASIGILVVHTPPYQPQGRGKIERYFRSVREQFLANLDRKQTLSLEDLNERLWAWIDNAYHRTQHSALGTTPLLRWQRDIEHVRQLPPATDLRRLFFHRLHRLVRRDCTFLLQNRYYEAPPELAGETIEVRFDPLDSVSVEIYFEGKSQGVARLVDPVVNGQIPSPKPVPSASPEPTSINFVELLRDQKNDDEDEGIRAMVETFFGFKKPAFGDNPDAKQLFASQSWTQVKARLQFLVDHHGTGLLTGEVGAGKSTAARTFTGSLNPNLYKILYLHWTCGSALDLLRQLALELDLVPAHHRGDLVRQISEAIVRLNQSKKQHPILICDEAQLLPHAALEQLPLLLNFDMDSAHYLTLLLVGQPLLRRTLSLQMHEPLRQRIAVQYHLEGLSREELDAYLAHQLKAAGVTQPLFDDTARQALYQATKGIPRKVNKLVLTALRLAAARKAATVNEAILLDATTEALL